METQVIKWARRALVMILVLMIGATVYPTFAPQLGWAQKSTNAKVKTCTMQELQRKSPRLKIGGKDYQHVEIGVTQNGMKVTFLIPPLADGEQPSVVKAYGKIWTPKKRGACDTFPFARDAMNFIREKRLNEHNHSGIMVDMTVKPNVVRRVRFANVSRRDMPAFLAQFNNAKKGEQPLLHDDLVYIDGTPIDLSAKKVETQQPTVATEDAHESDAGSSEEAGSNEPGLDCTARKRRHDPGNKPWVINSNDPVIVLFWTNWEGYDQTLRKLWYPEGGKIKLPGGGSVYLFPDGCENIARHQFRTNNPNLPEGDPATIWDKVETPTPVSTEEPIIDCSPTEISDEDGSDGDWYIQTPGTAFVRFQDRFGSETVKVWLSSSQAVPGSGTALLYPADCDDKAWNAFLDEPLPEASFDAIWERANNAPPEPTAAPTETPTEEVTPTEEPAEPTATPTEPVESDPAEDDTTDEEMPGGEEVEPTAEPTSVPQEPTKAPAEPTSEPVTEEPQPTEEVEESVTKADNQEEIGTEETEDPETKDAETT